MGYEYNQPTIPSMPKQTMSEESRKLRLNIRAILESCFSETKEDIQDRALHLISDFVETYYGNKN